MQQARPHRNRIAIGLPLYVDVSTNWLLDWFAFQGQIQKYDRIAGTYVESGAAIEFAMNQIVRKLLILNYEQMRPSEALGLLAPRIDFLVHHRNKEIARIGRELVENLTVHLFDYILFIEHDNTMPEGLLDKVGSLDPDTHKIVGFPYFGRSSDDQRPIPGEWNDKGDWDRLSYERIKHMMENPGFHEVGSVGMGCTAIHRTVFERWPNERKKAWFHPNVEAELYIGHDVNFCYEAKKFGVVDKVWLNTELEAGHVGVWKSSYKSYAASREYAIAALNARIASEIEEGAGVIVPFAGEDGVKKETREAVDNCGVPATYHDVGSADSAYHELLSRYWAEGKTVLTVEQDIVPGPDQLRQLLACEQPWCGFEYEYPPFPFKYAGLGCTKLSGALMRKWPQALEVTGTWSDPKHPARHWCRVDGNLKDYLMQRGERMHLHGQVQHLTSGKTGHGCTSPEEAMEIAHDQGWVG